MSPMSGTAPQRPVVLCCDPGLDDAWLIATLLGLGVDLRAVVVSYGCSDVDHCLRTAAGVLRLADREDIPIIRGAAEAIGKNPVQSHPERFGGSNGFMDVELPPGRSPVIAGDERTRAEAIRGVFEACKRCTFLNSGPATTAALVERHFPGTFSAYVEDVHVMAGALDGPGNSGSKRPGQAFGCAEFNVFHDAESLGLLLNLRPPAKLVTWDQRTVCLGRSLVRSTRPRTELGRALLEATANFFSLYGSDNLVDSGPEPVYSAIDVLLAFSLIADGDFERTAIRVTTEGQWYGETSKDPSGSPVDLYRPPPGSRILETILDVAV